MTKRAAATQAQVRRNIKAARLEGLRIAGIRPDGTLIVGDGDIPLSNGWLRMVPGKTSYKRKTVSEKPILPVLSDIIARSPTGDLTFLVTDFGKPFTRAGFGNWFRNRCDEAALPHCTAHGLRKAGATIAADEGASDRELMALYDWTSVAQANVYTAAVNRKRLAEKTAQHIAAGSEREQKVSHLSVPPKKSIDKSIA